MLLVLLLLLLLLLVLLLVLVLSMTAPPYLALVPHPSPLSPLVLLHWH